MDDIGGIWRTVGGKRIFIKDGQDLSTAMKESGKFTKKEYKYEKEYKKYIENHKEDPLPQKFYEKMKEIGLSEEEINGLKSHDIYKTGKEYRTKEEYQEISKKNIKEKSEHEEQRKKDDEKLKEYLVEKSNRKIKKMEEEGITSARYDKEYEAELYRRKKEKEVQLEMIKLNKNSTGYTEDGKSVRALRAEESGKFPKSECAKMLGVSQKQIEENIQTSEWHHSGGDMYNKIDYYDISKYIELADYGIEDYIDNHEYKDEIKIWTKMTGRKKYVNKKD